MLKLLNKVFLIFILLFSIHSFVSAAESKSTITTYYPSPRGVFEEMTSNVLAVGDTNASSGLDAADLPPASGQVAVARSVIFNPVSATPAANPMPGELVYVNSDTASATPLYKQYMYYNGSTWQPLGGVTDSIMYITKEAKVALSVPAVAQSQPECPTNWTPVYFSGTTAAQVYSVNVLNWYLPCYRTDKNCRVMYIKEHGLLSGLSPTLPACPEGWFGIDKQFLGVNREQAGTSSWNSVRICTTCQN